MNAETLLGQFAASGTPAGPVLVFDDCAALELIAGARQADLAISEIEMVRPTDLQNVEVRPTRVLGEQERFTSWDHAESFVEMLTGRGLFFLVTIESPWSTRLANIRSVLRIWIPNHHTDREPL